MEIQASRPIVQGFDLVQITVDTYPLGRDHPFVTVPGPELISLSMYKNKMIMLIKVNNPFASGEATFVSSAA